MGKRVILMFVFWINIIYICSGQAPAEGGAKKVEEIQRSYLTEELLLTPEEATKFFPVFEDYKEELKKIKKERGVDELEYAEQVLAIRKKFKTEFKGILGSDDRVNKIYVAEKNFKKILEDELDKRKKGSKQLGDKIYQISYLTLFN
jgi:hypothetical protein